MRSDQTKPARPRRRFTWSKDQFGDTVVWTLEARLADSVLAYQVSSRLMSLRFAGERLYVSRQLLDARRALADRRRLLECQRVYLVCGSRDTQLAFCRMMKIEESKVSRLRHVEDVIGLREGDVYFVTDPRSLDFHWIVREVLRRSGRRVHFVSASELSMYMANQE